MHCHATATARNLHGWMLHGLNVTPQKGEKNLRWYLQTNKQTSSMQTFAILERSSHSKVGTISKRDIRGAQYTDSCTDFFLDVCRKRQKQVSEVEGDGREGGGVRHAFFRAEHSTAHVEACVQHVCSMCAQHACRQIEKMCLTHLKSNLQGIGSFGLKVNVTTFDSEIDNSNDYTN